MALDFSETFSRATTQEGTPAVITHFRARLHDLRKREMIDAIEAAVRAAPGADKACGDFPT